MVAVFTFCAHIRRPSNPNLSHQRDRKRKKKGCCCCYKFSNCCLNIEFSESESEDIETQNNSRIRNPKTSASGGLLELPDRQKQQQLKKQQQTPSHSNIVNKDRDGTRDQNCVEDQITPPSESDQWVISIKELLCWYLITLKLRETVESGIPRTSASNGLLELPDQEQQLIKKQQQTPSHCNIVIKDRDGGDQWVISIKEKLNQASQDDVAGIRGKLSIYNVPQHLREGAYDHKAFVPQIVSLGPYHHGKKLLRQMDCHKWRSLHAVLKRTNQDIKDYIDLMKELEEEARACYEGPIGLSSNEFVEMMVLDGCFLLELFQGAGMGFTELGYPCNDPVFAMRGSMHSIQRDMMMLENQLPLFILIRLLELQLRNPKEKNRVLKQFNNPDEKDRVLKQFGNPDEKILLSKLALRFFKSLMEKNTVDTLPDEGGLHCLDVLGFIEN